MYLQETLIMTFQFTDRKLAWAVSPLVGVQDVRVTHSVRGSTCTFGCQSCLAKPRSSKARAAVSAYDGNFVSVPCFHGVVHQNEMLAAKRCICLAPHISQSSSIFTKNYRANGTVFRAEATQNSWHVRAHCSVPFCDFPSKPCSNYSSEALSRDAIFPTGNGSLANLALIDLHFQT
ncbi:hypothetical protein JG687_00012610 [Phytophthora cactorum]|uniref:Uncharacterized protein n=1 Tax=Phytophthora cactorum TaxID=29920 RepID=A0A8T1U3U1_9STRA|nr:hypothetical protein GQ600_18741 [Phytophthora cactorum]KAG6953079.1 hypothetical protein JG687_00012610 [Phytophthora cactorum]